MVCQSCLIDNPNGSFGAGFWNGSICDSAGMRSLLGVIEGSREAFRKFGISTDLVLASNWESFRSKQSERNPSRKSSSVPDLTFSRVRDFGGFGGGGGGGSTIEPRPVVTDLEFIWLGV